MYLRDVVVIVILCEQIQGCCPDPYLLSCKDQIYLFTVRNSSCEKVMFLHLSVSHSVNRVVSGQTLSRQKPPILGRQLPRKASSPPPPPHETGTAADGTQPTGMHSCFKKFNSAPHLRGWHPLLR